jgi:type I restriction enzyme, R subunit
MKSASENLNELNHAERPAQKLLVRLGWSYVPREILATERPHEREVLLKDRLTRALLRLNEWMTAEQAERVIFQLERVDAVGLGRNQKVHEYLVYGMPLGVEVPGGRRTRIVRFFDFEHPDPEAGRNEYMVTTQFRVRRANDRDGDREDDERVVKPDLVLFVNGIPLVVMEAKSPSLLEAWRAKAVRQLRRYQEAEPAWHGTGAPELFHTNLFCVALCGASAALAPIGGAENAYVGWKSIDPFAAGDFEKRFGVPAEGQARLIAGLLRPATLLDVLRDFVVFELEEGRLTKKLPRYQQYRAVRSAVARMLAGRRPEDRGGVIWHTQGSGKSLTMLFLATALRRQPSLGNPTIVIVTDRTQLDQQITDTFRNCGFPEPERAKDTGDLRRLLRAAPGRTVMTTVQKFEEVLGPGARDALNSSEELVVMVDEAHRTQYGNLAAKMRAALPNATFVGFTGTPIDKGFKSTMKRFGGLIDSYTIPQSVEDGATVPIKYEARLAELQIEGPNTLDKLFDALFGDQPEEVRAEIRRRYANKETIAEAEQRIEAIALDISGHFKSKVRPNGFKAQVVAPSRAAVLRYVAHLRAFGVAATPIITWSHNDGPEYLEARSVDETAAVKAFKRPGSGPDVLVVVDKLLTGFDAPIEQVLYLDKALRDHGLLQAIARVNRRFSHEKDGVPTEKTYGLVVDYHGVSRELKAALEVFDWADVEQAMVELPADPGPVVAAAADRAESHFRGLDLKDTWACVLSFAPDAATDGAFKADAYERFEHDYREFSKLMDQFLPNRSALPYVDRLKQLTVIRAYVRAQYLREDAAVDWTAIGAKVKGLIDSRIGAEVRKLMTPVSILDRDFDEKVAGLPHDEARASLMEHAIRAQIKERIAENPAFYERLSETLERIIRELRQRLIDAAEACRQMRAVRTEVRREQAIAEREGLTPVSFAVYGLLAEERGGPAAPAAVAEDRGSYAAGFDEALKVVARDIDRIIEGHRAVVDWHLNLDVQREMRRDIKRTLRTTKRYPEASLDELARRVVDVARRRLA